jgi:hypothetical protein
MQNQLFQDLRVCNKAWKKLVNNNGEWFHNKSCDLVLHLEQQDNHLKEQVQQKRKWKSHTFGSHYIFFDIDQYRIDVHIDQKFKNL